MWMERLILETATWAQRHHRQQQPQPRTRRWTLHSRQRAHQRREFRSRTPGDQRGRVHWRWTRSTNCLIRADLLDQLAPTMVSPTRQHLIKCVSFTAYNTRSYTFANVLQPQWEMFCLHCSFNYSILLCFWSEHTSFPAIAATTRTCERSHSFRKCTVKRMGQYRCRMVQLDHGYVCFIFCLPTSL